MEKSKRKNLLLSQKLAIISAVFNRKEIRPILDDFSSSEQLVEAHEFMWDKLVEFHYLTQKGQFSRTHVTQNMMPSTTYQKKKKCDLPKEYCKGVECIWSNPDCAGEKIKNNMEVIAKTIIGYIEFSNIHSRPKRKINSNIKTWI